MTIQFPRSIQITFFIFVKVVTASQIYSFISSIQDDDSDFTYTFMPMYIIERLGSLLMILFNRQKSCWHVISIFFLGIILMEDFFILSLPGSYSDYVPQGIDGQSLGTSSFSMGMHILIFSNIFMKETSASILVPGFLVLAAFFLTQVLIFYLFLFHEDKLLAPGYQKEVLLKHFQELGLALLHFSTFITLVWINSYIVPYFSIYLTLIYTVLSLRFLISVNIKESQRRPNHSKEKTVSLSILYLIKQMLHIEFDSRSISNQIYPKSMFIYGKFMFDRMIEFSFMFKSSLLIVLIVNLLAFGVDSENEYIDSVAWSTLPVIVLSVASAVILGQRFKKQVFDPYFKGPEIIEIISFEEMKEEFEKYMLFKQKKRNTYYSNLKMVQVIAPVSRMNEESQQQIMIDSLLCGFQGSIIEFGLEVSRKFKSNEQQSEMEADIIREIDVQRIISSIERHSIIPSIKFLKIRLISLQQTHDLTEVFKRENIFINILNINNTAFDHNLFAYNKIVSTVNVTLLMISVYEKSLANSQIFNPRIILYDLFE